MESGYYSGRKCQNLIKKIQILIHLWDVGHQNIEIWKNVMLNDSVT